MKYTRSSVINVEHWLHAEVHFCRAEKQAAFLRVFVAEACDQCAIDVWYYCIARLLQVTDVATPVHEDRTKGS